MRPSTIFWISQISNWLSDGMLPKGFTYQICMSKNVQKSLIYFRLVSSCNYLPSYSLVITALTSLPGLDILKCESSWSPYLRGIHSSLQGNGACITLGIQDWLQCSHMDAFLGGISLLTDVEGEISLQMISRGMANRKIGSHEMNLESSRSHSIATVYCECEGGDTGQIPCYGKVSFVDLAGSERVKDTKTIGGMLKETSAINRSLFTLGKVRRFPSTLAFLQRVSILCLLMHIHIGIYRCHICKFGKAKGE